MQESSRTERLAAARAKVTFTPEQQAKVDADQLSGAILSAAPADQQQIMPLWLYRKLKALGVDMEGMEYDPLQWKEPHPDKPVRYVNRAARRAQKGRR